CRSPCTTRRSLTRGAAIGIGPTPVVTVRGRAVPLRTPTASPAASPSPHARGKARGPVCPSPHPARVPRRITIAPVAAHVLFDLELQRDLNHPAGPFSGQFIQRRGDRGRRLGARSPSDKLQHRWRTFLPGANRGSGVDLPNIPRRVRRLFPSSTTSAYSDRGGQNVRR